MPFLIVQETSTKLKPRPQPPSPQFNSTMGLSAVKDRLSLASIKRKPTAQDPPLPLFVYQVCITITVLYILILVIIIIIIIIIIITQ
jgi:hypothetical protein